MTTTALDFETRVFTSDTSVTVFASSASGPVAVAEASRMLGPSYEGVWYVNRVLVRKERGKGIGTKVLEQLKHAVYDCGCVSLIVEPGGYGSDPDRLDAFYRRAGFVDDPRVPEALVWRPTTD